MDNNNNNNQQEQDDLGMLNSWPEHNISNPEDAFSFAATEQYADPFHFGSYSLSEEYPTPSVPQIPDYSHETVNEQLLEDPQPPLLPPTFPFSQENQAQFQYTPTGDLVYPPNQNPHPLHPSLAVASDTFVNPQQLDASFNRPRASNGNDARRSNTPSDAGTPPLDASGQRRINRSFTTEQKQMLEAYFAQHRYPSKQIKEEMMANTGLGLLQINNWFTRKRLAEKEGGMKDDSTSTGSGDSATMSDTFGIPMYPNPVIMNSFAAGTNNTMAPNSTPGRYNFPTLLPRPPSANASSSYAKTAQSIADSTHREKPASGLSAVMSQLAAMVDVSGGLKDDTDIEAIRRLFQKETNLGAKSVLLKTLQKTTNQNVLKKIAESKVTVVIRNWLVNATKENSDLQVLLLEVIKHLPISIEMLKTTNMGKLVRKAGTSDKPDVQRTANEVERHLKSAVQDEAQRRKEEEEREKERLERERKEKIRLEKEREREKAERAKKEVERRAKDREERERKLKERETQRLKEVEERRKQREAEAAKKAELVRKSTLEEEAESRKKVKIGGQDAAPTAVTNFDFFNQLAGPQTASRPVRPSTVIKVLPVRKSSADAVPSPAPPSSESTSASQVNPNDKDEDKADEEESPEKGFEIVLPPAPKNTTSFTDMYHMAEDVFHDLIPEVATSNTAEPTLLSSTLPTTPSDQPIQDPNEATGEPNVPVVTDTPSILTETTPQDPSSSLTANNRLPGRPFTIRKATEAEVAIANAGTMGSSATRRPSKGILKRTMEGEGDFEKLDGFDEGKGKKRQRRISFGVRFAPENELVKVRLIEARVVNKGGVHRNAKDLDRNEGRFAFKRTLEADQPWATPRLIQLPGKIDPNLRGKHSNESEIQAKREESVLMAIYLNKEDIPTCPSETDVDVTGEQEEVKIIPTEDVKQNAPQFLPQNPGFASNNAFNLPTNNLPAGPGAAPEVSNNISDILKNLTSMGLVRPPPPPPIGQPVKEPQPVATTPSTSLPGTGTAATGTAIPNLDSILNMLSNTDSGGNANQQRQVPTPMLPMQQQNRPAPFQAPNIPAAALPAMGNANGGMPAFDPNLLTNIMATINGVLKPGSQNIPTGPSLHAQPTPPAMMGMPPPMGMPGFSPWDQGHLGGMQPQFNFRPAAEFSHPPHDRGRGDPAFFGDSFRGGAGRGMRGGGQRGVVGGPRGGRGGVPKRGGRGGGAVGMGDGGANNWDPATRAGAGKQQYSENRRRA